MNIGGRRLKIKCTSVIMILLIAISATQLSSITLSNGTVVTLILLIARLNHLITNVEIMT
jgi:hypothetical protein